MDFKLFTEFTAGLAADWDALLEKTTVRVPFLHYAYQKLWWETRGGGEWPEAELLIFAAYEDGRLVGLASIIFHAGT